MYWPVIADLAGELEPGRARPEDHDPPRPGELFVARPVPGQGRLGVVGSRLGRVGVGGARREDEVVGRQLVPGGEGDPPGIHGDGPVAQNAPVGQQSIVGQEDPR